MVFQSYALYPQMNVYANMSFGLRSRGAQRSETDQRVRRPAEILGISGLLGRGPKQLSGGHGQRVAMGSAKLRDPQVFLFDEPLSNLDAKLLVRMRAELSKLHEALQAAIVCVSHDQILDGGGFRFEVPSDLTAKYRPYAGQRAILGIRPEHVTDALETSVAAQAQQIDAVVEVIEPIDSEIALIVTLG